MLYEGSILLFTNGQIESGLDLGLFHHLSLIQGYYF
jgi:hypothetical protein